MIDNREVIGATHDNETGEVTRIIRKGDRILSPRLYGHVLSKYANEQNSENSIRLHVDNFVKINNRCIPKLVRLGLRGSEWDLLFFLLQYTRYVVGKAAHGNGKRLTKRYLETQLDMSATHVRDSLSRLKKHELIRYKTAEGVITLWVNPFVFAKGMCINKTLFDMFCDTEWHVLSGIGNNKTGR